ncbi:NADP-dependent malic enzyme [Frateuria aurantia]
MALSEELRQAALEYHRLPRPGKIKVTPTTSLLNQRDLSLAYSPGVAAACDAIVEDPSQAAQLTARANLVAVISNGTAVLGLGNIGPLASKPVMEGKGVLFQKFAGIDVFDIEIDERDPEKLIDIIASLEPTFGGINLEDIKAPECFVVERTLRERMKIPVFHDDQHGTAIIVGAALLNALHVTGKQAGEIKVATTGLGAAGISCLNMLMSLGVKIENILGYDIHGVVHSGRTDLDPEKARFARETPFRTLAEIVDGADVFLGLSAAGILTKEMVATMASQPIIFALANPSPEILPEDAREVRPDCIIATGRSDYPNQVNNALCFPYLFRGALDVGATVINEEMKVACVKAIAELARRESSDVSARAYGGKAPSFGPNYLIPQPFDPRLLIQLPPAIARAAMDSGVATRPIENFPAYLDTLTSFVYRTGLLMKPIFDRAKSDPRKVVFAEGEEEVVLRAVQTVVDEGLAKPILIGRPDVIERRIQRTGLRLEIGKDIELCNIHSDVRFDDYWQHYHKIMERRGVTPAMAKAVVRSRPTVIGSLMVARGEAGALISGMVGQFQSKLDNIQDILGLDPQVSSPYAMTVLATESGPYFFLDTHVQEEPTAEQIAEATILATRRLKLFGIVPKVALLSAGNFGSRNTASARKMQAALELIRKAKPRLEIEGEMQADVAMNPELRSRLFPNTLLEGKANVFVFANLDAANIAFNLSRVLSDGVVIGPILMGIAKPAHVMMPQSTVRRIINMTAVACVEAQIRDSLAT